jgi:hypothetical protein
MHIFFAEEKRYVFSVGKQGGIVLPCLTISQYVINWSLISMGVDDNDQEEWE